MRPRAGLWGVLVALALVVAACRPPAAGQPAAGGTPAPPPTVLVPTPTTTPMPVPTEVPATVPTPAVEPLVKVNGSTFIVELAVTSQERRRGLAGRDSLSPGRGMLFVLDAEQVTAFTMGGMRFPLDFLWISSDLRVVDVTENAPPSKTGEPLYWPRAPVRYVLEVNAGEVAAHGIRVGAAVELRGIPSPPGG